MQVGSDASRRPATGPGALRWVRALRWAGAGVGLAAGLALLGACDPGATLRLVVTTTADGSDADPGDGVCEMTVGAGDCSLRAAIDETNAQGDPDLRTSIVVEPGLGTIALAVEGSGEDANATGDLDVTAAVRIIGNGVTIDASGLVDRDRVLEVHPGADLFLDGSEVTSTDPFEVSGAKVTTTITGGFAAGDGEFDPPADQAGGGIRHAGGLLVADHLAVTGNRALGPGGGIAAEGDLAMGASAVSANTADGPGGGIRSRARLVVSGSVVEDNLGGRQGGGIAAYDGDVSITDTTLAGNTARYSGEFDDVGDGGGAYLRQTAATLTEVEVVENLAAGHGGGIGQYGGTLDVVDSTVDGKRGALVLARRGEQRWGHLDHQRRRARRHRHDGERQPGRRGLGVLPVVLGRRSRPPRRLGDHLGLRHRRQRGGDGGPRRPGRGHPPDRRHGRADGGDRRRQPGRQRGRLRAGRGHPPGRWRPHRRPVDAVIQHGVIHRRRPHRRRRGPGGWVGRAGPLDAQRQRRRGDLLLEGRRRVGDRHHAGLPPRWRGTTRPRAVACSRGRAARSPWPASPSRTTPGAAVRRTAAPRSPSAGHNLSSDATCGLGGVGDLESTDPLLGALADHGGPTATRLPAVASPAVDAIPAGTTGLCDGTYPWDQRGLARPSGAACDIGAVGAPAQRPVADRAPRAGWAPGRGRGRRRSPTSPRRVAPRPR